MTDFADGGERIRQLEAENAALKGKAETHDMKNNDCCWIGDRNCPTHGPLYTLIDLLGAPATDAIRAVIDARIREEEES